MRIPFNRSIPLKIPVCLLGLGFVLFFPAGDKLYAQGCALNVTSGSVTLSNTSVSYCSVSIAAGATLIIGGAVTINVSGNVDIEGMVEGGGLGYGSTYAPASGPGPGGTSTDGSGSGGGHGGPGGGNAGGVTYDSPTNPVLMGSQGGSAVTAAAGAGGAAFLLTASGNVTVNGMIDMSGGPGSLGSDFPSHGGGGGGGGTISINASALYGSGSLLDIGGWGAAGDYGGGGGGGGRIRLCAANGHEGFVGSIMVIGGQGGFESVVCAQCIGCPCFTYTGPVGSAGTYYDCNPTNTPTPTPVVTCVQNVLCFIGYHWDPGVCACVPNITTTPTATPTSTPTVTFTVTPSPSIPCDQFYVSKNLFRPSQGSLSVEVAACGDTGPYSLMIYNSAGEHVRTLEDQTLSPPFSKTYTWDGTNKYGEPCADGVYVLRWVEPTTVQIRKLILVR